MKTGRNDPCPCGSGKKYKKCCLAGEAGTLTANDAQRERDDLRANAFSALLRFASRGQFRELRDAAFDAFVGDEDGDIGDGDEPIDEDVQLKFSFFHLFDFSLPGGQTLAQTFLARAGWQAATGLEESDDGFTRSLGHIRLEDDLLVLEVTSRARAARGRRLLQRAAGDALRYRSARYEDVRKAMARHRAAGQDEESTASDIDPEHAAAVVLDYKQRHYRTWPDEPLPALDGHTPRDAARSAPVRGRLVGLLKEMENLETRGARPDSPAFDFAPLWQELGLERPAVAIRTRAASRRRQDTGIRDEIETRGDRSGRAGDGPHLAPGRGRALPRRPDGRVGRVPGGARTLVRVPRRTGAGGRAGMAGGERDRG